MKKTATAIAVTIILNLAAAAIVALTAGVIAVEKHNEGFRQGYETAAQDMTHNVQNAMTVPCATENDHNCYWDADVQGNGQGRSFIDVAGTAYPAE